MKQTYYISINAIHLAVQTSGASCLIIYIENLDDCGEYPNHSSRVQPNSSNSAFLIILHMISNGQLQSLFAVLVGPGMSAELEFQVHKECNEQRMKDSLVL
ncbi:hypothetical protein SAY87_013585 [Trapa incisa]|uniref:Uncharacterized protein n=1 Tax=Trapa incisa TaxID=236973 RepID=A0AAN7QD70_9MYRT|nr:hypothetical protein SAY87_013585 [Trapa incisa]